MGDFSFGKYMLHIQCPFRIVSKNEKIIIASYDMYLKEKDKNRYDTEVKKYLADNWNLFVKNIDINLQGDLKIIFSNDDRLEIFVNSSTEEECWRFFEVNADKKHLVISGIGDDYE